MPDDARIVAKLDALLPGGNAGDMPVELPTRFHLVVNLATASALGIMIPNQVLARANEVIRG